MNDTHAGFSPCQHDFFIVFSIQSGIIWLWHCLPQTSGLGALLWLLVDRVAQQCLACGRAALTLGQRLPYCGPTTFLPFRAYSPSPPVLLTGAQRPVVSSTFLAHNSMTVINTSTDSVLSIKKQHSSLASGTVQRVAGQPWPIFTAASSCCCWVIAVTNHWEWTMNVISEVIIKELVI